MFWNFRVWFPVSAGYSSHPSSKITGPSPQKTGHKNNIKVSNNFYLELLYSRRIFLKLGLLHNDRFFPTGAYWTRMHSSRMRTSRSLTVCLSLFLGGSPSSGGASFLVGGLLLEGCLLLGGASFWGASFLGGLLGRDVPLLGGVSPSWGVSLA